MVKKKRSTLLIQLTPHTHDKVNMCIDPRKKMKHSFFERFFFKSFAIKKKDLSIASSCHFGVHASPSHLEPCLVCVSIYYYYYYYDSMPSVVRIFLALKKCDLILFVVLINICIMHTIYDFKKL